MILLNSALNELPVVLYMHVYVSNAISIGVGSTLCDSPKTPNP